MKDHIFDLMSEAIEKVDRTGNLSRDAFIEAMGKEGYSPAEIIKYGTEKEKRDRKIDSARRR